MTPARTVATATILVAACLIAAWGCDGAEGNEPAAPAAETARLRARIALLEDTVAGSSTDELQRRVAALEQINRALTAEARNLRALLRAYFQATGDELAREQRAVRSQQMRTASRRPRRGAVASKTAEYAAAFVPWWLEYRATHAAQLRQAVATALEALPK